MADECLGIAIREIDKVRTAWAKNMVGRLAHALSSGCEPKANPASATIRGTAQQKEQKQEPDVDDDDGPSPYSISSQYTGRSNMTCGKSAAAFFPLRPHPRFTSSEVADFKFPTTLPSNDQTGEPEMPSSSTRSKGALRTQVDGAHTPPPAILVHCQQGRSRSVTIVVAYLMEKNGWGFDEALAYVQARRPIAEPNMSFASALRAFATKEHVIARQKRRLRLCLLLKGWGSLSSSSTQGGTSTRTTDSDAAITRALNCFGEVCSIQRLNTSGLVVVTFSSRESVVWAQRALNSQHCRQLRRLMLLPSTSTPDAYVDKTNGSNDCVSEDVPLIVFGKASLRSAGRDAPDHPGTLSPTRSTGGRTSPP